MKNFIKAIYILLFMGSSFVTLASDAKYTSDCYDKDGHLYHTKINPQDFKQTGHLLSDNTIEKIKNLHKQHSSPSFYKISKKNSELFLDGEKPRSILFMNGQIFISYRDLAKTKRQGHLGARPLKGSRSSNIPFLYENSNKKFIPVKDKVKLAWDVNDKVFTAIRVTFSAYLPGDDPDQSLKNKGFPNERESLRKMNRLYGEMIREKKASVKEDWEEDPRDMVFHLIYSAEKLIRGTPLDIFLNNTENPFEARIATIAALKELQYLHNLWIVHGDVWGLHNFFYDDISKQVFLIDFEDSIVEGLHKISKEYMRNKINQENLVTLKSLLKALSKIPNETQGNKHEILSLLNTAEEGQYADNLEYYMDKLFSLSRD